MIAFHTDNLMPSTGFTSSKLVASSDLTGSEAFLLRAFCSAFFIGPNSYKVTAVITMKTKIKIL